MKDKILILTLLFVIPLIVGGCFKKANHQAEQATGVSYQVFTQEVDLWGGYKVKYPSTWQVTESSSGKFPDLNDQTVFKVTDQEEIKVLVYKTEEQEALLALYIKESESQTQIDAHLADDYLLLNSENNGERLRLISIVKGNYLFHLLTNKPGSADFEAFINNFTFLEPPLKEESTPPQPISNEIKLKLYFDDLNQNNQDCLPDGYLEVIVYRPEIEIGLIPLAIKSLIQLSSSNELAEQSLGSTIPLNTKLLSFGYENNTAIVNFNQYLNEDGGSCQMTMRRAQIEQTLKALNEISNLRINNIEIQVEGQTEEALQP